MAKSKIKLIFVDADNYLIKIIDNEVREYNWTDIQQLADEISGSEVLYITSLEKVNGTEVVDMISSHTGKRYAAPERTGRPYIHTCKPGKLIVPHKDIDYEPLIFENTIDFKQFSEELYDIYPSMRRYVELNFIEIVDEGDVPRIRKEYNEKMKKIHHKQSSAKDKSLDSILVRDSSAKKLIDKIENDGYDIGLDTEELDITNDVINAEIGAIEDEDYLKTAKEAGIDIDNMDE